MDSVMDLREWGGADAYLRTCPSRTVLDVLANKWTCLVIGAVSGAPQRFGQLRRRLDGVTPKMLTQTLRTLERDGLVSRSVYPTMPPRVEYTLTPLGLSVDGLLHAIMSWAEDHYREILVARESYDERAAREPEPV